ncbi:hypothetical protein [Cryptosporangium sp. NPDC051539]|uniref:hypothetical protein n=1 Tax=Cryptosporangium sp. NPDC051539 TaxID=3363962 RepID=UPI0037B50F04
MARSSLSTAAVLFSGPSSSERAAATAAAVSVRLNGPAIAPSASRSSRNAASTGPGWSPPLA